MKNTVNKLVLILISIFVYNTINAQSIWATADDIDQVKYSEEFYYFNNEFNLSITKPLSNSRQSHLQQVYEISCNCDVVDLYAAMHKVPGLDGIEYGPVYKTLAEPDDYSLFNNPNGLSSSWHLDLIWAQAAWDVTHGTEPIAISDQNYFVDHEDLVGKVLYYDATNTSSQGHGTAVATLAGANTNNGINVSSIGYDSQLGLFRMNYNEVLAAAYDGYKVINMSWTSGCAHNQYIEDALHEAYGLGSFLVASAGNGSTCGAPENLVYPSAYDVVFSVSSVGPTDSHENLTSPQSLTHQHNATVDLTAPGYDIPLTAAPGWNLFGSGTSYASPIVAGTVGLIISAYPGITPSEIKYILQSTSINIDAINPDYIGLLGAGRLNAGEAVKVALSMYVLSQTTTPINPINEPSIGVDYSAVDGDGNNGHGNDEDGVDPSNPGQGNGNGNGRPGGNGNNNDDDLSDAGPKSITANRDVYDMNGKLVNFEYAPHGMYLIVENGVVIRKIIK